MSAALVRSHNGAQRGLDLAAAPFVAVSLVASQAKLLLLWQPRNTVGEGRDCWRGGGYV